MHNNVRQPAENAGYMPPGAKRRHLHCATAGITAVLAEATPMKTRFSKKPMSPAQEGPRVWPFQHPLLHEQSLHTLQDVVHEAVHPERRLLVARRGL